MPKRSTPARNTKGRFVKGGGKSRPRKTTAIVRSSPRTVTRYKTRTVAVARRRRRGGGGGGGGGFIGSLKARAPAYGASAVYAWVTRSDAKPDSFAIKAREYLKKVPTLDSIGAPATHGILAAFIASRATGRVRYYTDLLAQAALHQAAANFGAAGWDLDKTAKMAGDDDMSGDFGDDEAAGYED